jgi:hypothetical protein
MRNVLMAVAFQLGWFACVLSGARGKVLPALLAAAAALACNLWFTRQRLAEELRLMAWVTLVGFAVETVNLAAGVFTLTAPARHPWLCPVWLALLWTLFATLLRGPLAWLSGRYGLAALLGALLAAPNYFAGARLGAVTMNANRLYSFAVLAALWALAMPVLLGLARTGRKPGEGGA